MIELLSIGNVLVHIPLGKEGYALSYIEAFGVVCGLVCIYLASIEKVINYLFGLMNVSLFAIIFFQIHLYASLLLQLFFFGANIYGWFAWTRRLRGSEEIALKTRWLSRSKAIDVVCVSAIAIAVLTVFIEPIFTALTRYAIQGLHLLGMKVGMPIIKSDPYPFWDSCILVLSIVAQILMTRKYVENWWLWFAINLISVVVFTKQGVYVMAIEYVILLLIAANGIRVWTVSARRNGSVPSVCLPLFGRRP